MNSSMFCSENQKASQEPCILKRKITSKTSEEQLLEYIKLMEDDIIFRTKTITPGIEPDEYVNKKWEKLARKLNALDTGPQLSVANWKTRFINYKNTTRAKYRKKIEDMKRTGGGPPTEILLSPLEERLLDVCGRVAITGSKKVTVAGGLQSYLKKKESEMVQDINSDSDPWDLENINTKDVENTEINTNKTEELIVLEYVNDSPSTGPLENTDQIDISESPCSRNRLGKSRKVGKQYAKRIENKSIKVIGEELLGTYKQNTEAERQLIDLKEKYLQLETTKLKFEIAKYQYENPNFHFDYDL